MSNDDTQKDKEAMNRAAYDLGYRDGLTAYSHWKDGQQWVGTTPTRLDQAIQGRRENWNYRPPQ